MDIVLSCPGCGKGYKLAARLAGKRARCKRCLSEFEIPWPGEADPPIAVLERLDQLHDQRLEHARVVGQLVGINFQRNVRAHALD